MKTSVLLALTVQVASAFQFPFQIPFFKSSVPSSSVVTEPPATPRIAIIGAGAGGSSAAFWISKAKERFGVDVDIDVYDREEYIGGRSTIVYPYGNTSLPELELGASIFVQANKNLWRASEEFNLTRRDFRGEDYAAGIWDGEQLLLSFGGSWWDTLRILWRYGISAPRKTESFVSNMINTFLTLYSSDTPRWDNLSHLAETLGWRPLVTRTMSEHLLSQGVSEKYAHEVVEAATRVNYGQNVDKIHALEGACSMAASGSVGIKGGNFQLFEQFLRRSKANIFLKTPVHAISRKLSSTDWVVRSERGTTEYKAVILAAPFHFTNISLPTDLAELVPEQPYVHLHVTLLTTASPSMNSNYFKLPPTSEPPKMMLTTHEGARKGGKEPEFNSISYHGLVREGEWAVKIFSKKRISDEWLDKLFNSQIGWVYRKEWKAYPELPPTSSFPPVKLDDGFYYVNAFEPFISTMETETIASRNVVDLLLNEKFGIGICGAALSPSAKDEDLPFPLVQQDFVLGWDC
ncbi:Prenylcysteine lyase-domain-containing protein [Cyathus striatus]|nr:Prenylcysteine lyase-domain-containing protein [Cyathus striatus]